MRKRAPLLVLLAVLAAAVGLLWWALGDSGARSASGDAEAAAEQAGRGGHRGRRDRTPTPSEEPDSADAAPAPDSAPVADQPARPPEALGVLSGNVRSDRDLLPIEDAVLKVLHPTGEEAGWGLSNEQGDYEVRGLPSGELLVLRVEAEGHLTGHCCNVVTTADRPMRRDLVLVQGPAVRVSVTDGVTRRPARGVVVSLLRDDANVARAMTGADGRAVVRAPHFGAFGVRLSGPEHAPTPLETVTLWPGQPEPRLARHVTAGGSLAVSVHAGQAVDGGVRVTVTGPGYEPVEVPVDAATGVALFEKLPAGVMLSVVATADDGRHGVANARLRSNYETTAVVALGAASRLSGKVVDTDGRPVRDVHVRAGDLESTANANGVFDFGGVRPGVYTPIVDTPGYLPSGWPVEVTVGVADDRSVTLVVKPAGEAEIRGRVLDRGGRPLDGVTVRIVPAGFRSVTGDDGRYRITRLPVGREQTIAVGATDHYLPEPGPLDTHVVQPEEPGTIELDLVLQRYPEPPTPDGEEDTEAAAKRDDANEASRGRRKQAPTTWPGFVAGTAHGREGDGGESTGLAGVLVWVNGRSTYTDNDGRFRMDDVPLPLSGGVEIQFKPPTAMYEPLRHFEARPVRSRGGIRDVDVRLRMRPVAFLDVHGYDEIGGKGVPLRAFWYQSTLPDVFLAIERPAGSLVHCVTYDRTWMHLPPLSKRGLGFTRLRFTRTSTRGLLTTEDGWRAAYGRPAQVRPQFPTNHVALNVRTPVDYKGGRVVLLQTAPWTEGNTRVPGGDAEAFASIQVGRRVTQALDRPSVTVPNLAAGTWQVEVHPPKDVVLPPLRKLVRTNTTTIVRLKKKKSEKQKK